MLSLEDRIVLLSIIVGRSELRATLLRGNLFFRFLEPILFLDTGGTLRPIIFALKNLILN